MIADDDDRSIRLGDIVDKMQQSIRELSARMEQQRNWPRIDFGNLCAITGSGISAWKAVIDQDWQFGLTGAALSLAPAVYSAFSGSNINLEDRPLAYATLAEREFA